MNTSRITRRNLVLAIGAASGLRAQGTKIPSDWPADVAVYAGEVVVAARLQDGKAFNATVKTRDALEGVFTFYRGRLASDGWTVKDIKGFRGPLLQGKKANRTVTIEHESRGEFNYVKLAVIAQ